MKKITLGILGVAALLTACDPVEDSYSNNAKTYTAEALGESFSFTQADEAGNPAADGNYFTFETNPSTVVTVYNLDSDGNENILSQGVPCGTFKIAPKRGSDSNQTFFVRTMNADGSYTDAQKQATVYVMTELSPEMRLLASDAYGKKIWKWDTDWRADGGAWGNMGYSPGDGDSFVSGGNGIWWACPPADLAGQLSHSDTGVATGEEDPNAYMEFYDDGKLKTFDANGNLIREGKFSVTGWNGERNQASIDGAQAVWAYGTFTTTEGSILFPFKINGGGMKPTDFELMQLDASHLKLIYAAPGTGNWGEATWWAFKSVSDPEAALTDFGAKSWTWDTEFRGDGGAWGNMGYAPGEGSTFAKDGNGIWWGCPPADLTGQLGHSNTGEATGEEDPNAYMTFDWKAGTIKSYDANGTEIRSGKFEIKNWGMGERTQPTVDGSQASWAYGTLSTTAGSILFPFQINSGGNLPTDFEILQADNEHLKLVYAAPGTGSWSEATWWAFKKK